MYNISQKHQSCRSSATHPSRLDSQYLIQEYRLREFHHLDSQFHMKCFLQDLNIKFRASLQIGWSIFTSGVSASGLPVSSEALSLGVKDQAPCIPPDWMVISYFGISGSRSFNIVVPLPSFEETFLMLTTFGTSIGWSKMERPGGAEITGSHSFCGLVDPAKDFRVYVMG
jgi:hypothetical protein